MSACSSTMRNPAEIQGTLVFFDLETTGPGPGCDIVQLGAVSGGYSFNLYVVPRCKIYKGASALAGLRVRHHQLFFHRWPVPTKSHQEVLTAFLGFLQTLGRPLLVDHNVWQFDCPVLERALEEVQLSHAFRQVVAGFLDTFSLCQELLKGQGLRTRRVW
ncbi:protein PML-like isoform X1 [Arapaima gigas]